MSERYCADHNDTLCLTKIHRYEVDKTVMTIKNHRGYRNPERAKCTYLHGEPSRRRSVIHKSSVYYWWYEYLKRNEDYRRCCESSGRGRLAKLYQDFGDVHATTFFDWFFTHGHGERLFAEPPAPVRLDELITPKDWKKDWSRDEVMIVIVPLQHPKRRINRWFSRLLDERHEGRPGHTVTVSQCAYPVTQKYKTHALKQILDVYDFAKANPKLKMHEIGKSLGLVPSAMPKTGDSIPKLAKKRNTMTATVSRYLRKANAYIRNTAIGKFPCADESVVQPDA